jgi:hypothetical protein
MASIFATAGAQVYIGPATPPQSADFVAGDFAGMSFTEIGWLESIGEFGDESAEITFDAIGEGRTQKLKGIRNAGNMDLVMGVVEDDPGQVALLAAEALPDDFAFKVVFNNAPAGGGTPSERYFIGKVMTARENLSTANSVVRRGGRVAINSNVVRVEAAP